MTYLKLCPRSNRGRVFSHDLHDAVFRTTANICISHDTVFRTTSQIARHLGSHDKNMILRFARRLYSHDNKNSKMHFFILPLLVYVLKTFTLSLFFSITFNHCLLQKIKCKKTIEVSHIFKICTAYKVLNKDTVFFTAYKVQRQGRFCVDQVLGHTFFSLA